MIIHVAFRRFKQSPMKYSFIVLVRDVNKDLTPKDQDKDKDLTPKDQDKDKDLSPKDQDKDKDLTPKDQDKDLKNVLKESLRTRTRTSINIPGDRPT